LEAALALLEERDREVFCRYYGLADGRRHTPEEIARGLDRSLSACETWRQLAEVRLKTALGRRMSFEEAFRAAF
jgi:DNA-directed RNA polymerase specialized sigma24 family protein